MSEINNTEDIINRIRAMHPQGGPEGAEAVNPIRAAAGMVAGPKTPQPFKATDFDVNPLAIYDRLSDGSYIAKYKNYVGEFGNEDRLARQQSSAEKWGHGLMKMSQKAIGYAWDSVAGAVYGTIAGIGTGDFRHFWDNDFANSMDDFNKSLDYNLPNYYTDEEKSMDFLESMGTANFWANDVTGALAFVGGALLPELVIGAATGGASAPVSIAKFSARSAARGIAKSAAKSAVKNSDDIAGKFARESLKTSRLSARSVAANAMDPANKLKYREKGINFLRSYSRAIKGKTAGDLVSTAAFIGRTSSFEASMEARHNFHDAVDNFYNTFREKNGRDPSPEEAQQFIGKAVHSANYVYGANMAILSVSNAVMFGNKFNIGVQTNKRIANAANRFIGLGVKKKAGQELARRSVSRGQKVLGNAYFILGKPAVEGLYEEGLQGVAGKTMQSYLEAQYGQESEKTLGVWAHLTDALEEQYTTSEGWKEMGIGFIIGSIGGFTQGKGPAGTFSDSYAARSKRVDAEVEQANTARTNLLQRMKTANAQTYYGSIIEDGASKNRATGIDNSMMHAQYIKGQESIKSHGEIRKDFEAVVDQLELTDDQVEELGGQEGVEEYKRALRADFNNSLSDYRFAKKAVAALGLDNIKETKGNRAEIADAMTMNIMMGRSALESARIVASQIDAMTGATGTFDYFEHYNNLSAERKEKAQELRKKKRRVRDLEKQAIRYQQESAGLSAGKRRFSSEVIEQRKNAAAENYVLASQELLDLKDEISVLEESFKVGRRAEGLGLDHILKTDPTADNIGEALEAMDRLEEFAQSLENSGRGHDALILTDLIDQYKGFSDAYREMNNTHRKMLDTNFFSSSEGKGLTKMIKGKKYQMSDEFREVLRENDEIIDRSMRMMGVRDQGTIEEELERRIANNDELSDREKYRMEAIIRLQLGYNNALNNLQEIQDEAPIVEAQEEVSDDPLKGDTIDLVSTPQGRDLSSLDVINELIDKVATEINKFKRLKQDSIERNRIKEWEEKLKNAEVEEEITEEEQNSINETAQRMSEGKWTRKDDAIKDKFPKALDLAYNKIKLTEAKEAMSNGGSVSILDSSDYKRMNYLITKQQNEELTEEEQEELEELEDLMDLWINLTGTTVENIRLSDLVKQKIVLETAQVQKVESVADVTSQEKLDQIDTNEHSTSANYAYGQTYQAVTAKVNNKGYVEISGISAEALLEKIGFDVPVAVNDRGNVIIQDETGGIINKINEESPVSILATNRDLTTNYNIVLETTEDIDGNPVTTPMQTTINDFGDTMNPDAIYGKTPGEALTLEVSSEDGINEEFFERYEEVKDDPKALASLKEEMADRMVIRVKDAEGNFVAVLKSKRSNGKKDRNVREFEGLRNELVANDEFLEEVLTGNPIKSPVQGVTVKRALVGHPNFRFVSNGDGTVSVESTPLTDRNLKDIKDIGYVRNGEVVTRSGEDTANKTFLHKQLKLRDDKVVPFVVLEKGGQMIAYPVKANPRQADDMSNFEGIFKSDMNLSDKAAALNTFMASRGVDIKLPGNAFVSYGNTNITEEFFNEKLAQLESIVYFHDFNDWVDQNVEIVDILERGVSIDIDIKNPFHSPKLMMDLSGMELPDVDTGVSQEAKTKVNKSITSSGVKSFKDKIDEGC